MTHCRRDCVLTFISFLFLFSSFLHAQRPSERYQSLARVGRVEPHVKAFVSACLQTKALPGPVQLFSQGAWYATPDLAQHMKEQGADDDGTALVWPGNGKPKAVSQWVHDDEFDRHTLACMNSAGVVTHFINEYMPGLSEPDLHWIYVHSFVLTAGGKFQARGRYTDWNGRTIAAPKLTSEDRDFIAGERQYTRWSDFDFASAFERTHPVSF